MDNSPTLHATGALLDDVCTTHFESGAPLLLRRGDTGTIVLLYDDDAYEVEFADQSGRTYAMLPLAGDRLLLLHDVPERVSA